MKKLLCIAATGVILISCVCIGAFADAAQPAPDAENRYVIKSERGRLVVYKSGEEQPFMTTETFANSLPKSDKDRLEQGIEVSGEQDLRKTLEDYCS